MTTEPIANHDNDLSVRVGLRAIFPPIRDDGQCDQHPHAKSASFKALESLFMLGSMLAASEKPRPPVDPDP